MKSSPVTQKTDPEWVEALARLTDYLEALRSHGTSLPDLSATDLLTRVQLRVPAHNSPVIPGKLLGLALAEVDEILRASGVTSFDVKVVGLVTVPNAVAQPELASPRGIPPISPPVRITSMVPQRTADAVPTVGEAVPSETQAS